VKLHRNEFGYWSAGADDGLSAAMAEGFRIESVRWAETTQGERDREDADRARRGEALAVAVWRSSNDFMHALTAAQDATKGVP